MDNIFEILGKLYTETQFARFLMEQPTLGLRHDPTTVAHTLLDGMVNAGVNQAAITNMEAFLAVLTVLERRKLEINTRHKEKPMPTHLERVEREWNRYCELKEQVAAKLAEILSAD